MVDVVVDFLPVDFTGVFVLVLVDLLAVLLTVLTVLLDLLVALDLLVNPAGDGLELRADAFGAGSAIARSLGVRRFGIAART